MCGSGGPLQASVSYLRYFVATITLEPMIFFIMFGQLVLAGAEIQTNLLLKKICLVRLNLNDTVCENLNDEAYEDTLTEAQKELNEFNIIRNWITQIPCIFYALIAGSLSDDFGRKFLLIFPVLGHVLASISSIINYAFIDTLPLEFFYLDNFFFFLGGNSVYYLGIYGYGASATTPKDRAHRLARLDAFEQLGLVVGTFLSPLIFNHLGYYPTYVVKAVCETLAMIYLLFFVKEVVPAKATGLEHTRMSCNKIWKVFERYIITPLWEMVTAVFKRRERNLRFLFFVQLFGYGLYWFCLEEQGLLYLFSLKQLDDFDGTDWAYFNVVQRLLGIFGLLVVMPIIAGKYQWHETVILIVISITIVTSLCLTAFITKIWQLYVVHSILFMRICQYGTARSLFTKCVEPDEIGKIFSAIALVAALVPFGSSPAFKLIYNETIDTFPGAFILLAAACYLVVCLLQVFLFTQRRKMLVNRKGEPIKHGIQWSKDDIDKDANAHLPSYPETVTKGQVAMLSATNRTQSASKS